MCWPFHPSSTVHQGWRPGAQEPMWQVHLYWADRRQQPLSHNKVSAYTMWHTLPSGESGVCVLLQVLMWWHEWNCEKAVFIQNNHVQYWQALKSSPVQWVKLGIWFMLFLSDHLFLFTGFNWALSTRWWILNCPSRHVVQIVKICEYTSTVYRIDKLLKEY